MVAVSDEITGPYISNARNPILSTRHLSYDFWVNSTGHADMVELPDGRWYMVALGIRGDLNRQSNMGRETHLIPVEWEREPFEWKKVKHEWPVCAPQTGRVERHTPLPFPDKPQHRNDAYYDNFDSQILNPEWNFRRVPLANTYSLSERPGYLRVYLKPEVIQLRGRCSLMGVRQGESDFEYAASMQFKPDAEAAEAGISLFLQDDNYIHFTLMQEGGKNILKLVVNERKKEAQVVREAALEVYKGTLTFKVTSRNNRYYYYYSLDQGTSFRLFAETAANLILCNGYTGAYVGVYASSNGAPSTAYADFDWIHYKGFND
jgi:alpha-N-arabinofuranosidase